MVYTIDLCTFIHGERISLEVVSTAIGFAPSEECAIFLATQSLDEARHLEVFTQRLMASAWIGRKRIHWWNGSIRRA